MPSFTATNLTLGTAYLFDVVTVVDGVDADPSNEVTYTPTEPLAAPTGVTLAYQAASGQFTTGCTRVAAATSYLVERKIGPMGWRTIATVNQPASGNPSVSYQHPQDGTGHTVRWTARQGTLSSSSTASSLVAAPQGAVSTRWRDAVLALGTKLRAGWMLADAAGTTATAAKGPNGTYGAGEPARVPAAGGLSPVRSDPNRQHRWFDGVDDVAVVADQDLLDLGDGPFTLVIAARRDLTGQSYATLVDKGAGAYAAGFVSDAATVYKAQEGHVVADSGAVTDQEPHLLILSTSGVWRDNQQVNGPVTDRAFVNNAAQLGLGGALTPFREHFSGSMEGWLVDGDLSATERASLWAAFSGAAPHIPSTPANLRVTSVGSGQVTLAWDASPDLRAGEAYQVYVDGVLAAAEVTGTSYTATGLTNGRAYSFRVSAGLVPNVSAWSAAVSASPSAGTSLPSTPTGLHLVAAISSEVRLAWNTQADAQGVWQVYRGDGASPASWPRIGQVTSPAFTDATVADNTTYSYRVAAGPLSGAGTWTSPLVVVVPDAEDPPPPPPVEPASFQAAPRVLSFLAADGTEPSEQSFALANDGGDRDPGFVITVAGGGQLAGELRSWEPALVYDVEVDAVASTVTVTARQGGLSIVAPLQSIGASSWAATVRVVADDSEVPDATVQVRLTTESAADVSVPLKVRVGGRWADFAAGLGAGKVELYVQPDRPEGVQGPALWIPTAGDGTLAPMDEWEVFS